MKKWEYNIIEWSMNPSIKKLDKSGNDGWELVTVTCDHNSNYHAFFKREI